MTETRNEPDLEKNTPGKEKVNAKGIKVNTNSPFKERNSLCGYSLENERKDGKR